MWMMVKMLMLVAASLPGGDGGIDWTQPDAPNGGPQLPGELQRGALLPLPAHGGLRGVRLGLDHRSEALRGKLLQRRVSLRVHAEVPAHTPRPTSQPLWHWGTLLRSPQDLGYLDALLRRQPQHHLRRAARNDCGPLRLLLSSNVTPDVIAQPVAALRGKSSREVFEAPQWGTTPRVARDTGDGSEQRPSPHRREDAADWPWAIKRLCSTKIRPFFATWAVKDT